MNIFTSPSRIGQCIPSPVECQQKESVAYAQKERQPSNIETAFGVMGKEVNVLAQVIEELEVRLASVLIPKPPETNGAQSPSDCGACQIHQYLLDGANAARFLSARVGDILARLQL